VTDLDEVELPVGETEIGPDLRIRGTFTMPGFPPRQDGVVSIARCVVIAVPAGSGGRLATEYFPRSDP
jgi:hypothetical protein